ncbi:MAG: hypothetical protein JRM76_06120 [Nitrososphaerota archaeon]|jgi:hypothetical protein|nr:hypothetical protein [Nitrososphaerota archaeon]MDG6937139.1 hypothetical protein [Nitrososphaerota archaeon]MDG6962462.1 hypothetical protein [Nitrososphaerota archaeon]MDG6970621.1 hypothetical protein [Nitrososphaerota archaeon]MDG6972381.1 hypothetical protein [Nitrososphaerota archaeon]
MKTFVSMMCHPEREPKIDVPQDERYELYVNKTPNYAEAYKQAIGMALERGADLVTADTDGYHPAAEIAKLAAGDFGDGAFLVLPYRENIGFQSKSFSYFFSLLERRRVRDSTSGLCRLSLDLMRSLPPLKATDMTVHIEILKRALKSGARLVQYGYLSSANDEAESRRTKYYQLKLIGAAFR